MAENTRRSALHAAATACLFFLLSLALFVVSPSRAEAITAQESGAVLEEGNLAFGNNGYPYGESKGSNQATMRILLDEESGTPTQYRWMYSSNGISDWDVAQGWTTWTTYAPYTATMINGRWLRCEVKGGTDTIISMPVQTIINVKDTRVYITNGRVGYCWQNNIIDMVGKVSDSSTTWARTSFNYGGWKIHTSTLDTPSGNTSTNVLAANIGLMGYFLEDDDKYCFLRATVPSSHKAFAIVADTDFNGNDWAPLTAVMNARNEVKQLQIVATGGALSGVAGKEDSTYAFVIKTPTSPSMYWVGQHSGQRAFQFNTGNYNTYKKKNGIVYESDQCDGGMAVSWTGLAPGGSVEFGYAIGTMTETGAALAADFEAGVDNIMILDTDAEYYYRIADSNKKLITGVTYYSSTDGGITKTQLTPTADGYVEGVDGGIIIAEGLKQATEYYIQTVKVSTPSATPTSVKAVTKLDPQYNGNGGTIVCTPTGTSLTFTNINATYQYALQNEDGTKVKNFAVYSSGTMSFSDLDMGTEYYLVARKSASEPVSGPRGYSTKAIKITFNNNDNDLSRAYRSVAAQTLSGTAPVLTSETPVRWGYTFQGWATAGNKTAVAYTSGQQMGKAKKITFDTDQTFYAVWSPTPAGQLLEELNRRSAGSAKMGSGEIVVLQKDVTLGSTLTANGGASYSLNLNGKTLTGPAGSAALSFSGSGSGALTLSGSGGKIVGPTGSPGASCVSTTGNLIVDTGVTLQAGDGAVGQAGGNGINVCTGGLTITVKGTVLGGNGGSAVNSTGKAGAGGHGINFVNGSTYTGTVTASSATVKGGNGGMAISSANAGAAGLAVNPSSQSKTGSTFTNGSTGTVVSSSAYSGVYDGAAHSITVTAAGATITYSTSENGTYSSTLPTRDTVGTTTVYYQAKKSDTNFIKGSAAVTLTQKPLTVQITAMSRPYSPGNKNVSLTATLVDSEICTRGGAKDAVSVTVGTGTVPSDLADMEQTVNNLSSIVSLTGSAAGNYKLNTLPTVKVTFTKADRGAPTAPKVSQHETVKDQNNGILSGITADMEYRAADTTTYKAGSGADITGLPAGTYYVRYKLVSQQYNASPDQTLVIQAGATLTVTFDSDGGSAVAPVTGLTYQSLVAQPANPTKKGYNFLRWVNASGGAEWIFVTSRVNTENVTLRAVWEENTALRLMNALNSQADGVAQLDTPGTGVVLQKSADLSGKVTGFGGATQDSCAVTLDLNGFTITSATGVAVLAVPSDVHLTLDGSGAVQGHHGSETAAGAPALENAGKLTINFGVTVYGGNGGLQAGNGGNGVTVTGAYAQVTVLGTVQGGMGGSAKDHGLSGTAGAGGHGIDFTGRTGGSVSITGKVRGGDGGMATGSGTPGAGGSGLKNVSGSATNGSQGAKITSSDVDVTYDGTEHFLTVTGKPQDGNLVYWSSADSTHQTANPGFKLADQGTGKDDTTVYTVYYQVTLGSNNLVWDSKTITIRKKALTVSVTPVGRVYEIGRTTVDLTGGQLTGVVSGDEVTSVLGVATLTGAPAGDKMPSTHTLKAGDAGNYSSAARNISTAITLSGKDAANYYLAAQPNDLTVTITKAERPAITAEQITATAETFRKQADGTLTLAEAIGTVHQYWCLEWQIPTEHLQDASGNSWSDTDLTAKTKLKAGTYYVRYKETTNYQASPALKVVINEGGSLTVTFDSDGGSDVAAIENLDYNARIAAPTDPTKHGYNFLRWVLKDSNPEKTWDFSTDTVTTAGITLKAIWEDNTARRLMDVLNSQADGVAQLDTPGTGVVLQKSAELSGKVAGFGGALNDNHAVTLNLNGFTITSATGVAGLAVPSDVHLTLDGSGAVQGHHGSETAAGAPALENAGKLTINSGVTVYGGHGGIDAGAGGNGVTVTGAYAQVTVLGTVQGGMGGSAKDHGLSGTAGAGGHGIDFTNFSGGSVTITGKVRGGDGGMATGSGTPGPGGLGLKGISGTATNGSQGAKITSANVDVTYDGAEHFITVTGKPQDGNLVYWSSADSNHQTENPGFKLADQGTTKDDVTVYTVYYQVTLGSNNLVWDSKTITIRKKALTVSATPVERVYEIDRTTVDLIDGSLTGVVEGDTVIPVLGVANLTAAPQAALLAPNTSLQPGDAGLYTTALGNLSTAITLSGKDAANYYLAAQPSDLSVTVTKASRPALTADQIQVQGETYRKQANGSLTFLPQVTEVHQYATLEWRFPAAHLAVPALNGDYETFPGLSHSDLKAGTYYVRYKETTNYQASPALQLLIPEGAALSVTFDSTGGSAVAAIEDLDYNARIAAPTDPTKHGYNFLWWVRSDAPETQWDFAADTVTTAGITLKAVWEENTARRLMNALNVQCAGVAELNTAGTGVNLTQNGQLSGTVSGFTGALQDDHTVGLNLAGFQLTSPANAPAISVPEGVHLTLTAGSVQGSHSTGSDAGATAIETAGTLTVGTGASVTGGNGGLEAGLGGTAIRAVGDRVLVEVTSGATVTGGNGGSAVDVRSVTLAADGGIGIDFTDTTGGQAEVQGAVTGGIGGAAAGEASVGHGGRAIAGGVFSGDGTVTDGADGTKVSASGYHGVYDGAPHAITVHAALGDVAYSTSPSGPYTADNPTFTTVGTYTVYYRVTLAPANVVSNHAMVRINKKELPVAVQAVDRVYDPGNNKIDLVVSIKDSDLCSQLGVLDDVRPVAVPGTVPSEFAIGDQTVTFNDCIHLEGDDHENYLMSLPLTVRAVIHQAPQPTPTAEQVYVTRHETILNQSDGVITGVTEAMEYRYATSSQSQYTPGTGADLTDLPYGSYFVRFKEVPHQYNASEELEVPVRPGRTLSAAFDSDGGSAVATVTGLTYHVPVPQPEPPTKHGYNFLYWVLKGSDPEKVWDFTTDTVTDNDITLQAVWEENTARRLMNAINAQVPGAAVLDSTGLQVHLTKNADLSATLRAYDGATRDDHRVLLDLENFTLTGPVGQPALEVPKAVDLTLQDGFIQGHHGAGTADGAVTVTVSGRLQAGSGTSIQGGNGGLEAGRGGNAVNLLDSAVLTVGNGARLLGGRGGSAAENGLSGTAGTGGDGILATAQSSVTIEGSVRGGNGGMAGDSATPGAGGLGVRGVQPHGAPENGQRGALITSQGVSQVYDSRQHAITVSGQPEDSSTVYWSEGIAAAAENPTFRMAGTYQVFYRVTLGDNNLVESSDMVVLDRKDLTLTLLPEQRAYLPGDYSVKWLGASLQGKVEGDNLTVQLTRGLLDDTATDAQGHTARYHYDHTEKTHSGLSLALALPGEDQDSTDLGVAVTGGDRPNYILHWTPVEVVITKANRPAVQYVNVETMPETAMHRGDGKITIHSPLDTVEMKGPATDPNGVPGEFIDFTSLVTNPDKDVSIAEDGSIVVEWLPMGTYTIRYQEDENYFTSPEINVILAQGKPHEVIYDGNAQKEPVTLKREHIYGLPEGSTLSKPEDPFQRGYNFICWTTDPEGTQPWTFEGEGEEPDQVLHPLALYAQWEESASRILMDRLNAQLPDSALLNQDGSAVLVIKGGEVAAPVVPDDGTLVHYGTTAVQVELNGFTLSSPAADTTQPVFSVPQGSALTLSGGTVRGRNGGLGEDGAPAVRSQGSLFLTQAAALIGGNGGLSGGSGAPAIDALSGSVTVSADSSATGGSGGSAPDSTAGSRAGTGGDGIRKAAAAEVTVLGLAQGGNGGLAAGLATAGRGGEGVTGQEESASSRNGLTRTTITAQNIAAVYDGEYHTITVENIPEDAGTSVLYWSSEDATETQRLPHFKLADRRTRSSSDTVYTVYYRVALGDNNRVQYHADVTLSKAPLTVAAAAVDRVYEKDLATVSLTGGTLTGVVPGDVVGAILGEGQLTAPPQAALLPPNEALVIGDAGTYSSALGNLSTSIVLTGPDSANYYLTQQPDDLVVHVTKAPRDPISSDQISVKSETRRTQADGAITLTGVENVPQYGQLEWLVPATHNDDPLTTGTYQPVSQALAPNLKAGTYYLRYRETTNYQASAPTRVSLPEGRTLVVTFDPQDGEMDNPTLMGLDYGKPIDAPTPPVRKGYNFAGWSKDPEGKQAWGFGVDPVLEDMTLYAKWSRLPIYEVAGTVLDSEGNGAANIKVVLTQGTTVVDSRITDDEGDWVFETPSGVFNVIVYLEDPETGEVVKYTELVDLSENILRQAKEAAQSAVITIDLPDGGEQGILITDNAGVFEESVAGGLQEEAHLQRGGRSQDRVTVTLTITEEEDLTARKPEDGEEAPLNGREEFLRDSELAIQKAGGGRLLQFFDLSLTSTVIRGTDSGEEGSVANRVLHESLNLLQVVLPFERGSRQNFAVLRYHQVPELDKEGQPVIDDDGNVKLVWETQSLKQNPKTDPDTKEYVEEGFVVSNDAITLVVDKFSLYAIGYSNATPYYYSPTVTPPAPVDPEPGPQPGEEEPEDDWPAPYTDINKTSWYNDGVRYAVRHHLMRGYDETTFAPYDLASRAMIATIIWNMEQNPDAPVLDVFGDVKPFQWFAGAAFWNKSCGIIEGIAPDVFAPDQDVTREQLVTILYRYAVWKGIDVSTLETSDLSAFEDADQVGFWAKPAMQWAVTTGLVKGRTDTTLNPKDTANRAEIACLFTRFCQQILGEEGQESSQN